MRLNVRRALTNALSIVVCASALFMSSRQPLSAIDTTDRNGRFDVQPSGSNDLELASVRVDTNRDGRSDVEEFYEHGALVRRESDRDFNDQIDLVQEFDPATRQIVR